MFFEKAVKGKNHFFLYLLTVFICMVAYTLGQLPLGLVVAHYISKADGPDAISYESFASNPDFTSIGISSNLGFLLLLFMFVLTFAAFWFCIKAIHNKDLKDLITPWQNINLGKIMFGFALWMILAILAESFIYFQDPSLYQFNFNGPSFLVLLAICVFILPIQTTFEEVFFRGYLFQGFGLVCKNKWMPLIITSVLFGLVHISNPEIKAFGVVQMEVYYISAAMLLGLVTILDDSLELAIGMHAATNFYGATLVSYDGSVIQTDSIMKTTTVDPVMMTIVLFISAIIFLFICYRKYNWDVSKTLLRPISFDSNNT